MTDAPPPNSAQVSDGSLKFREGNPYLALIGQTFDAWGVVDVVGDTRSHIAVKELPAAILKRIGLTRLDEVAAIERKIVLTHTKGFQELPRDDALSLINILSENLASYNEEMKERLDNAIQDYANDARGLREFLRDTKKEYAEYWAKEINQFRNDVLPQAVASAREVHDARKVTSPESGQPTPAAAAVLQSSKPTTPAGNPSPAPAAPDGFTGDSEDDDYAEFVAEVWRAPGAIKVEIVLQRVNYSGKLINSHLHSLLPRHDSGFYVNTIEAGLRKTYVSDRHKWRRDGLDVDSSAFRAIQSGVDPDVALRFAPYPASVEDALAPGNNHFRAEHRCFVIGCRNGRGDLAFRTVSGVRRGADQFTAHCHFRWGERRTFLYSRLESIVDAESGEIIPVEEFADRSIPLSPHGYMSKLKQRP